MTDKHRNISTAFESKLPSKITGIVFWGIVLIGLASLVYLLSTADDHRQTLNSYNALKLMRAFEHTLNTRPENTSLEENKQRLRSNFSFFAPEAGFVGVVLRLGDESLQIGEMKDDKHSLSLDSVSAYKLADHATAKLRMTIELQDTGSVSEQHRKNLIILVAGAAMIFGLILNRILQQILTVPFNKMINSAKLYASGDRSARFDEDGADEFAFLGRIINMSIESSEQHRQELEKAIEEEYRLRQSEEDHHQFVRGLINDMQTLVAVLKPDGTLVYINNTPLVLYRIKEEDVVGKLFWECIWFEGNPKAQHDMRLDIEDAANGQIKSRDIELDTAMGKIWISFSIHPVFGRDGNVSHLVPEGTDITERLLALNELENERQLSARQRTE